MFDANFSILIFSRPNNLKQDGFRVRDQVLNCGIELKWTFLWHKVTLGKRQGPSVGTERSQIGCV